MPIFYIDRFTTRRSMGNRKQPNKGRARGKTGETIGGYKVY